MKIIETKSAFEELQGVKKGAVLSIGNFDGVHIGHRKILAVAKDIALQRQSELTVMTFEPHPVAILHPEKAPGVLTPLGLKKRLLDEAGVDGLIVLRDSIDLLALSPQDFVERFLMKTVLPSIVVEGENFNFGFGRAGSVETLYNMGIEKGFEVRVIETMETKLSIGQSVKVSSTLIRNMLESGKVADVTIAMGRPYRLTGKIVHGQGKGRQLGFPTANMKPASQIVPAEGVYAGWARIADNEEDIYCGNDKLPAAISIGRAQTLGGDIPLMIEAHILVDEFGDLTGKWLALDFVGRIRGQQKFETEEILKGQIAKDCGKIRKILSGNGG